MGCLHLIYCIILYLHLFSSFNQADAKELTKYDHDHNLHHGYSKYWDGDHGHSHDEHHKDEDYDHDDGHHDHDHDDGHHDHVTGPALGDRCNDRTTPCETANAECRAYLCRCQNGYTEVGSECLAPATTTTTTTPAPGPALGARCSDRTTPCETANAECKAYMCRCQNGYTEVGSECLAPPTTTTTTTAAPGPALGARCSDRTAPCETANAECRAYLCRCQNGYTEQGDQCVDPNVDKDDHDHDDEGHDHDDEDHAHEIEDHDHDDDDHDHDHEEAELNKYDHDHNEHHGYSKYWNGDHGHSHDVHHDDDDHDHDHDDEDHDHHDEDHDHDDEDHDHNDEDHDHDDEDHDGDDEDHDHHDKEHDHEADVDKEDHEHEEAEVKTYDHDHNDHHGYSKYHKGDGHSHDEHHADEDHDHDNEHHDHNHEDEHHDHDTAAPKPPTATAAPPTIQFRKAPATGSATLDGHCDSTSDCLTASHAVCVLKRCRCPRHYTTRGDHCVPPRAGTVMTGIPYGKRCNSVNKHNMHCEDRNSECRHYRCWCKRGYERIGHQCQLSHMTDTHCTTNADCPAGHTVCELARCKCAPGYIEQGQFCLLPGQRHSASSHVTPRSKTTDNLGKYCTTAGDCRTAHAICKRQRCRCPLGHRHIGDDCIPPAGKQATQQPTTTTTKTTAAPTTTTLYLGPALGDRCNPRSTPCVTSNTECRAYMCRCQNGYTQKGNRCIGVPTTATAAPTTTTSAAVPRQCFVNLGDFLDGPFTVPSAEECHQRCRDRYLCSTFNYAESKSQCWLFTNKGREIVVYGPTACPRYDYLQTGYTDSLMGQTSSAEECQAMCRRVAGCRAFLFYTRNGQCRQTVWNSEKVMVIDNACNSDEFGCGDGTCIDVRSKCDRHFDCDDRSDESHSACVS